MRIPVIVFVLFATLFSSVHALAGEARADIHEHWWTYYEYGGHGPSRWSLVNNDQYAACRRGRVQSPINITRFKSASLAPIEFDYWQAAVSLENTGHALQVNFPVGNTMTLDGKTWHLQQAHFHHRAEHLIKGKRHGLEAHFVHRDDAGNLAIVAVMFKYGDDHPVLHDLGTRWPDHKGAIYWLPGRPYAFELLPASRDYYRYTGSMTMPPCTEGVTWIVMKEPLTFSVDQVWAMEDAMDGHNHRPLQRPNGRVVMR
jgi:carbonic anhydrase